MTGEFEGFLSAALRDIRGYAPEFAAGRRHILAGFGDLPPKAPHPRASTIDPVIGQLGVPAGSPLLPKAMWDRAVDESLPPGTITFMGLGPAPLIFDETHVTTDDELRTVVNALAHHGPGVDPVDAMAHLINAVARPDNGEAAAWVQAQIDRINASGMAP